jgi:hypothetical protein
MGRHMTYRADDQQNLQLRRVHLHLIFSCISVSCHCPSLYSLYSCPYSPRTPAPFV